MKISSFSSKNIYGYNTPINNNKNSEIKIYSNSPIKVNRKVPSLIKVNYLESYKLFTLSNRNKKNKNKKRLNIDLNYFVNNNLQKYNSHPYYFHIKIANQILFNLPYHLVSLFKDYLTWYENYDYLKNYYNKEKSIELIPKLGFYYQTYTLFIPIYFPLTDLENLISKYIKNKMKYLEISEGDNDDDMKVEKKETDKDLVENKNVHNSKDMNNKESYKENEKINGNNKDDNNNNNKLINTSEIRSENSCSLSNFFGIESVIKIKENSNYGVNNNFENQLINYSLLEQIKAKNKNKNKKSKDKVNIDYSLELAEIIQSFEEKERSYYQNHNKKNIKNNIEKHNDFLKSKIQESTYKSKTNQNFYQMKSEGNNKINKNNKKNNITANA
jgi:hypothetical protein